MKKIIILGSSPEGVEIIEKIRSEDQESTIILMAFDGYYPYQRGEIFMRLITKEVALDKIFCKGKDFYKKNKVDICVEKKILRINFRHRRIFTEEKVQINFDELFITGVPDYKLPEIKGIKKNGVYGLKKLKDIDGMMNQLPMTETVIIQSNSLTGLGAAEAFFKREKEVLVVIPDPEVLSAGFNEEQMRWMSGLEEKGLRILRENKIEEILGDKDVKAVRLKSGKVMSTELIVFDETPEEFKMFVEAGLKVEKKIYVNEQFKTNMENVFASGEVSEHIETENFSLSNI